MHRITTSVCRLQAYGKMREDLTKGAVLAVGLAPVHQAHIASALYLEQGGSLLVLTPDEGSASRLRLDIMALTGQKVHLLPARELFFGTALALSHEGEQKRLAVLHQMQAGGIFVASVQGALQKTLPPKVLTDAMCTLETGQSYAMDKLIQHFSSAGYTRVAQVDGAGQFAQRGDLLDIFPPDCAAPVRVEFWGEQIDTMHVFDVATQRRGEAVSSLPCLPCSEILPAFAQGGIEGTAKRMQKILAQAKGEGAKRIQQDLEKLQQSGRLGDYDLPLVYPKGGATALHFLPKDTNICVCDSERCMTALEGMEERMRMDIQTLCEQGQGAANVPPDYVLSKHDWIAYLSQKHALLLDPFLHGAHGIDLAGTVSFEAKQLSAYGGNMTMAVADMGACIKAGGRVVVLVASERQLAPMQDMLEEQGITPMQGEDLPPAGKVLLSVGSLSAGAEYPALGLSIFTDGQLLSGKKAKKKRKLSGKDRVRSVSDLVPGDLVVHEHHGIGRFVGMERVMVQGSARDFVKISFAGTDFLYVPATGLDVISKYIGSGGDEKKVRLSKLGGTEWAKARVRAKAAAKELAAELLKLYAEREQKQGIAFPPDDDTQRAFELAFPYEETDDQLRCIAEIKADMQSPRPMDRLLCGDVGFGKTEVALRAMMKCILGGKQAALLAPTTVLARQHYGTCLERFGAEAVKVALLSRYQTPSEQKRILAQWAAGQIDILVGTHKLFRKDLDFSGLGLLVVDEEQRFGVAQKEKLKQISRDVDVLTLSATPIPRTLSMSLSGIRDMSVLEEPPHDRHPVQTYVMQYSEAVIRDAIARELARGGQVYYLHNRVDSTGRVAETLQKWFPEASISVAHGKMGQQELYQKMSDLVDGNIDILVCTTIIETGIDIPNANTLIVEDADKMGLAQLHQLRGRVGRSSRHAFAYFTFRQGKTVSEVAQKRLSAVRDFAEFGSGFQIAMRDLEIRGAGNVLGPEQSGHMLSVGYELYLKLLEEAVREEQGVTTAEDVDTLIDIPCSAHLPHDYIEDEGQRIDLYRRIAQMTSKEAYADVLDEMIDRFGEPPKEAMALLSIALLRQTARGQGILKIEHKQGQLFFVWKTADFARLSALCAQEQYRGRFLLNAGSKPYLALRLKAGEEALQTAQAVVDAYAGISS